MEDGDINYLHSNPEQALGRKKKKAKYVCCHGNCRAATSLTWKVQPGL